MVNPLADGWIGGSSVPSVAWTCGFCGQKVGSSIGMDSNAKEVSGIPSARVRVCTHCNRPSLFVEGSQHPGVLPGAEVLDVPESVDALYREARSASAAGASTAAVMAARKILMNLAVAEGAPKGESFMAYVQWLVDNHYVPPGGHGWVDHIRKTGNEANHEIKLFTADEAAELIAFVELLLKFIYEMPARIGVNDPEE